MHSCIKECCVYVLCINHPRKFTIFYLKILIIIDFTKLDLNEEFNYNVYLY